MVDADSTQRDGHLAAAEVVQLLDVNFQDEAPVVDLLQVIARHIERKRALLPINVHERGLSFQARQYLAQDKINVGPRAGLLKIRRHHVRLKKVGTTRTDCCRSAWRATRTSRNSVSRSGP